MFNASGIRNDDEMNSTRAPANASKPTTVKGMRRYLTAGGKCPVITPEGMNEWATNMQKAKVITRGKKIQRRVSQLWILIQSALVSALGSERGIISSPSPDSLPKQPGLF